MKEWTWEELRKSFPDRSTDDGSLKTLKHLYRYGVWSGLINPESDSGKALWAGYVADEAYGRNRVIAD